MKLVRFQFNEYVRTGELREDIIIPDSSIEGRDSFQLAEVRLLSPVEPGKIVLVGLNYKDHARELSMDIPDEPIIFLKPPTAIIGPGDDIIYPGSSARVDYEAELAVVIGRSAKDIAPVDVNGYIKGYTCFNDVTARDLQEKDGQWTRAKSFDTFAPVGPWIETELDPSDLAIRTYLNGDLKQDSRTSEFIFSIPDLISFISGVMTLDPGDIVSTGTSAGIGPMRPGDKVTIQVEGIGELENKVAAGKVL